MTASMASIRVVALRFAPPGPSATNSMKSSSGSESENGSRTRPGGIKRAEWTPTPNPARVAAYSPLKLPLVQAMRQDRPAFSSAANAFARVIVDFRGELTRDFH